MTAIYLWLATAWDWVTSLRISTGAQRRAQQQVLAGAMAVAHDADARRDRAEAKAERAEADKREAQRILAIISEPLKDWDLADFPDWAENPDRSKGMERSWPLSARERAHIWEIVQAYRTVRVDAAKARASVTANDMLRGRTWGDQPSPTNRPARIVRSLP